MQKNAELFKKEQLDKMREEYSQFTAIDPS